MTLFKSMIKKEAIQIGSAVLHIAGSKWYEVIGIVKKNTFLCEAAAGDGASREQFNESELVHVRAFMMRISNTNLLIHCFDTLL
jgi:hypothetical protein